MSDFSSQSSQGFMPPPGYMPPQDPYALRVGFGKRLGAFLLDLVLVLIVGGIVGYMMMDTFLAMLPPVTMEGMEDMDSSMAAMTQSWTAITLGMSLVGLLYSLVEMFTGASPAKHILGIIVAHPDRRPGDVGLFVKRWIFKNISSVISLLATLTGIMGLSLLGGLLGLVFFIGCFFALGEKKQALHDMLAKTAIFHKEDVVTVDAPAPQVAV